LMMLSSTRRTCILLRSGAGTDNEVAGCEIERSGAGGWFVIVRKDISWVGDSARRDLT
jgi:hypothetical protein